MVAVWKYGVGVKGVRIAFWGELIDGFRQSKFPACAQKVLHFYQFNVSD